MSDSEEEESPDRQLKLVVLGDGTTGKVSAGPRRQRPAPLRRRGAPSPLLGLPSSALPPALPLRREQPVVASSPSRCRCRDTRRRHAG